MSLKKNIIYLHFKGKHLITSKSQYQYNYGQYLYFADLNLPQAFEVHFSNKERGESETQIGSNKLVEIPDKYFWNSALEIYAWVYLHDETNDGKTIYEVRIPLIKRARPTDKEPLPDQQSAIDKAIAELNNALNITNENADKTNADKTQVATIKEEVVTLKEEIDSTANAVSQDAQSANTAAERSEQSAQNSAESERKALDYSDEAKGYAQSAFESKDTASQKAQVATDAAAEAKDFRDEAETFKNEAEQIKQNVVDYRNETKGYRDEALTAKNDAQDSANAAQETLEQVTQAGEEIIESVRDLGSRYATQAETAANNAQASASQASASASASTQSASEAQSASTNAETYALNSGNKAVESAQSAQASANSATQAQGFANSASASAQSASGYASNALTYANTASSKASEASTSAQTASTKASEATQSATNASQSAQTAEQAKTASQTAQGLAESAKDSAISAKTDAESAKADAESARDEAQTIVDGISGALDDKAPVITDTASGSIASFTDGADDLPLKSLVIDINPVQDLHGQDSPYPAGGGKNKFDPNSANYNWVGTNGVITQRDACKTQILPISSGSSVTLSNANASSATNILLLAFFDSDDTLLSRHPLSTGATYITATAPENTAYVMASFFTWSEASYAQLEEGSTATTWSPYSNICPISGWTSVDVEQRGKNLFNVHSCVPFNQNVILTFESDGGMICENRNAYALIPTTAAIMKVPHGTYTVSTNGQLSAAVAVYASDDGQNFTWISNGLSPTVKSKTFTFDKKYMQLRWQISANTTDTLPPIMVELGSTATPYSPYTGRSITINLGQTVYGGKLDVLTGKLTVYPYYASYNGETLTGRWVSDRDKYVSGTTPTIGAQVVDMSGTGTEIQLSANQINSLYGVNNIWADSGDTEAEYRTDTKLFIERLTAPDSADMIADANITSGKYFMVGNNLFKATANIANGSAIIVGTNCTRKSLSEALNEINA